MIIFEKTIFDPNEIERSDVIPGQCYIGDHSRAISVTNRSGNTIFDVNIAWIGVGDDFWRDPIHAFAEVLPNKVDTYSLDEKKIRIREAKLKFTFKKNTFTDGIAETPGLYIACLGLTMRLNGGFTIWWANKPL